MGTIVMTVKKIIQRTISEIKKSSLKLREKSFLIRVFKLIEITSDSELKTRVKILEVMAPQNRDYLFATTRVLSPEATLVQYDNAANGYLLFIEGVLVERARWLAGIKEKIDDESLGKTPCNSTVH